MRRVVLGIVGVSRTSHSFMRDGIF